MNGCVQKRYNLTVGGEYKGEGRNEMADLQQNHIDIITTYVVVLQMKTSCLMAMMPTIKAGCLSQYAQLRYR
jgi:uncharacterized protein YqeY